MLDRRRFLTILGVSGASLITGRASAQAALPKMVVTKDPNCGCCTGWAEHMEAAGFPMEVITTPHVNQVKVRLGVPEALASCHTAEVEDYVIEGHVPADAIKRLLAERPRQAKGLAVSGMPMGAPGMEMAGMAPDTYEVILFGPSGQTTFARYQGVNRV